MRAAVMDDFGGSPRFSEIPDPEADGNTLLVDVTASALNPVDLRVASGTWHGATPEPPYIPGSEGVGVLDDGRRVWFTTATHSGSFAELCVIDPATAVELPAGLEDTIAACLGIAGLAGWLSLQWRARLQPDETVLVLGASGPVGQFAIQAAKLMGARRVVAAARSSDGLERALSLGADAAVKIKESNDLAAEFLTATEGGADVIIDPLWGSPAVAAVSAAARGGRLVQLGQSAGPQASLTSAALRGKGVSILGYSNFEVPGQAQAAAYRELSKHAADGSLKIDFETYPLEQIEQAWQHQHDGPGRKLVLIP